MRMGKQVQGSQLSYLRLSVTTVDCSIRDLLHHWTTCVPVLWAMGNRDPQRQIPRER